MVVFRMAAALETVISSALHLRSRYGSGEGINPVQRIDSSSCSAVLLYIPCVQTTVTLTVESTSRTLCIIMLSYSPRQTEKLLSRCRYGLFLIGVAFLLAAPLARAGTGIAAVQGNGLVSPLTGDRVHGVPGIVTFVTSSGFYLQDPAGDGDPATSDAVFVYTHGRPSVHVGEAVEVSGEVREYQPGSRKTHNLTVTEIHPQSIRPVKGGGSRIKPAIIGAKGRAPPKTRIAGPVPGNNGIAFYESLEGMRVQVQNPQVTGPTNQYGEIWVVADAGAHATGMNPSGGITLCRAHGTTDYNPERIRVDFPAPRSRSEEHTSELQSRGH